MQPQKQRPLLDAQIRTEFGDVQADTLETGRSRDLTFVPGFGDMKIARDTAITEKRKPENLPVNLRWSRCIRANGDSDAVKLTEGRVKGYRAVMWDDIGKHDWISAAPAGAIKGADGSIRLGDTQLMVCDQRDAAKNEARKTKNMLELANHEFQAGALVQQGGEVEKITGYSKAEIFEK